MDLIEIRFLSKFMDDFKFGDELNRLDDEYFVNFINKSSAKLISCLGLIKANKLKDEFQDYLSIAISSLQVFVLANWIYIKNLELDNSILNLFKEQIDKDNLNDELGFSNSDYQPVIKHPELLYLAKLILINATNDNLAILIWKLRFQIIYQSILNRTDASFEDDLANLIAQKLNDQSLDERLKMRFLIEICQFNLIQNKVQNLRELLIDANRCTRLDIKLSGALGKRTHFQHQAKSILFLNLTRKSIEEEDKIDKLNRNQIDIPKDMNLNDDTLLVKPIFLDQTSQVKLELNDDEETLLLAIVKFGLKCGVSQDDLLKEELLAYLEHLISNSTVWSVAFESMFERSKLESNERRKIERSMLQLNELIDKLNANQLNSTHTKLHLFYSTCITPIWKIKRKLADILISLACFKEALNIYIELDLWEEIVFCYKQIDRRDKAAEIIREQLQIKETPYLFCLLGDATDQIECYEKAWKLSNGKSYLSQKRLGYHYFDLKQFQTAIDCFKRSLELNCNQLDTLQRLGYSALLIEDYELAASAYRRVVECDLDNFQAWNNLSKAYIKLKDKQRAFRTLQEALKNNYENWKIWENYILVCVDVGAWNEVINAWNRLIDIKSKYEDDEIMNILINELCSSNEIGNYDNLCKRTLQLFGRMTANFQCSTTLWLLYAKLLIHLEQNEQSEIKILNCLQKAQRPLISKSDWAKNSDCILDNLKSLNLIYDLHKQIARNTKDQALYDQHFESFKLASNSILLSIKNNSDYWAKDKQAIKQCLNEFKNKMNEN